MAKPQNKRKSGPQKPAKKPARNPSRSLYERPGYEKAGHEKAAPDKRTSEKPGRDKPVRGLSPLRADSLFLHGRHAVEAALENKTRECLRLIGTEKALRETGYDRLRPGLKTLTVDADTLRDTLGVDSPHQGIALEVRPLPMIDLHDLTVANSATVLILDQVTDPHNVGACLRSAAALGASALITMDRNSPRESGVLARSASGALDKLPWLRVANLSQALDQLAEMGFWRLGLDGATDTPLTSLDMGDKIAIVMGSEGKGLRPLVRKHCDVIAKIPMTGLVESLNVSNAAAITLYEMGKSLEQHG